MPSKVFSFLAPEWFDEVESTNDIVKARLSSGADCPSGTVVAARRQTRGRGRMGNIWQSSRAGDLAFSFLLKKRGNLAEAGTLPMACGLAVLDFLASDAVGIAARCKWPNDIMTENGKICGILSESVASTEGDIRIVVGIGVNVTLDAERDGCIGTSVASLEGLSGTGCDPEKILPPLLGFLEARIALWIAEGFAAIRKDLERHLWGVGRVVRVRKPNATVNGIIKGIGDGGELVLEDCGGEMIRVSSLAALDFGMEGEEAGNRS